MDLVCIVSQDIWPQEDKSKAIQDEKSTCGPHDELQFSQ